MKEIEIKNKTNSVATTKGIIAFFEYLLAFFLVLECRSVYLYATRSEYYIMQSLFVVTIILLLLSFVAYRLRPSKKDVAFILFIVIYIGMYCILSKAAISSTIRGIYTYAYMFVFFYYYFSLIKKENVKSFLNKVCVIIFGLSIVSLFFWIFGTVLNWIHPSNLFYMSWGDYGIREYKIDSYLNIHFDVQKLNLLEMKMYRNTGIFVEAPMFSLNLIIGLMINLFVNNTKLLSVKNIVLIICTITTFSTGGFVLLFIILCLYVYKYFKTNKSKNNDENDLNKRRKKFKYALFLPLILIIAFSIVLVVVNNKKSTASFSTRIDDYVICYKAWIDKPLLGYGFDNSEYVAKYMNENRKVNTGLSNSIGPILANGGIYMFVYYLLPLICAFGLYKRSKNINYLIIPLVLLALSIVTIYHTTIMCIMFMALAVMLYRKEKNEEITN